MCGLFGIVNKNGKTNVNMDFVEALYSEALAQGGDAWGAIVGTSKGARVIKGPGMYPDFDFDPNDVKYIMGHTRAATHGSPKNNDNNHPVVSTDGRFAVNHNGVIQNYASHYQTINKYFDKDFKPKCEVDSQVFAELLSYVMKYTPDLTEGNELTEAVSLVYQILDRGDAWNWAAVHAVDLSNPDIVVIGRDTTPLHTMELEDCVVVGTRAQWCTRACNRLGIVPSTPRVLESDSLITFNVVDGSMKETMIEEVSLGLV